MPYSVKTKLPQKIIELVNDLPLAEKINIIGKYPYHFKQMIKQQLAVRENSSTMFIAIRNECLDLFAIEILGAIELGYINMEDPDIKEQDMLIAMVNNSDKFDDIAIANFWHLNCIGIEKTISTLLKRKGQQIKTLIENAIINLGLLDKRKIDFLEFVCTLDVELLGEISAKIQTYLDDTLLQPENFSELNVFDDSEVITALICRRTEDVRNLINHWLDNFSSLTRQQITILTTVCEEAPTLFDSESTRLKELRIKK